MTGCCMFPGLCGGGFGSYGAGYPYGGGSPGGACGASAPGYPTAFVPGYQTAYAPGTTTAYVEPVPTF